MYILMFYINIYMGIIKQRKESRNRDAGRGQASKRWEAIRARIRGKHGNRLCKRSEGSTERSAISMAFKRAKERRERGAQEERKPTKYGRERRRDTADGMRKTMWLSLRKRKRTNGR